MDFNAVLATLPSVDHLSGLNIVSGDTLIHHIPAVQGKLGSLRVYHALAEQFNGVLDKVSAQQGLTLFAEHTQDAKNNVGKHPNIDLLFKVINEKLSYQIVLLK